MRDRSRYNRWYGRLEIFLVRPPCSLSSAHFRFPLWGRLWEQLDRPSWWNQPAAQASWWWSYDIWILRWACILHELFAKSRWTGSVSSNTKWEGLVPDTWESTNHIYVSRMTYSLFKYCFSSIRLETMKRSRHTTSPMKMPFPRFSFYENPIYLCWTLSLFSLSFLLLRLFE